MQGQRDAQSKPGRLAALLAELEHQLRLSRGAPVIRRSTVRGPRWSVNRVRLSARLAGRLGMETGEAGLMRLGEAVPALLDRLDLQDARQAHLSEPLHHLDVLLQEFLAGLDAGDPLAQWLDDPAWDTVRARFRAAGTGSTVMADLEATLTAWKARRTVGGRPAGPAGDLNAAWLRLRRMGDTLFGTEGVKGAESAAQAEAPARPVLLLVDSAFRRDQLRQRLEDLSYRPETVASPLDLLRRLRAGPDPAAILCDNLEPSHNLARVADLLDDFPPARRPALILVAGGSPGRRREGLRARSLGGVGAWLEPFPPSELQSLLSR